MVGVPIGSHGEPSTPRTASVRPAVGVSPCAVAIDARLGSGRTSGGGRGPLVGRRRDPPPGSEQLGRQLLGGLIVELRDRRRERQRIGEVVKNLPSRLGSCRRTPSTCRPSGGCMEVSRGPVGGVAFVDVASGRSEGPFRASHRSAVVFEPKGRYAVFASRRRRGGGVGRGGRDVALSIRHRPSPPRLEAHASRPRERRGARLAAPLARLLEPGAPADLVARARERAALYRVTDGRLLWRGDELEELPPSLSDNGSSRADRDALGRATASLDATACHVDDLLLPGDVCRGRETP